MPASDFLPQPSPWPEIVNSIRLACETIHTYNAKWWVDLHTGEPLTRNIGELLMLVVSEISEAMEGHRKNLQDDKLPHHKMFEVELADAVIRIFDLAGGLRIPLGQIIQEKCQYNLVRSDHTHEARLAPGGKAY